MNSHDRLNKLTNLLVLILAIVALGLGIFIIGRSFLARVNPNGGLTRPELGSKATNDFDAVIKCLEGDWENENKCLNDFVKLFGQGREIKEILASLESGRSSNPTIESQCHPIAHAIGRLAFQRYGNVGDGFSSCDYTCHSGCYHGVIERMFYSEDQLNQKSEHLTFAELKDKVPGLCDPSKFPNPTNPIIFQCLHGAGHAILYTIDYKLEDALKLCDLIGSTTYDRSSCYGGVIMENVTAFDKSKRHIKKGDPHYPCNKLDEQYKSDCYMMQTSIMQEFGMSVADMISTCQEAPTNYQDECFISLGRDTSNQVRLNSMASAYNACNAVPTQWRLNCIRGVIYALVDNTWNGQYAYSYCSQFQDPYRSDCYRDTLNYAAQYIPDRSNLIKDCQQYSPINDRAFCK